MRRSPLKFSFKENPTNSSGLADFSGEQYTTLKGVNIPLATKVLDISFTQITNFNGLKLRNSLNKIIADKTPITSLKGLANAPNCHSISLISTPISQELNYQLSLAILFGDSLVSIDGKAVKKSIILKAKQYPPIAKELINSDILYLLFTLFF